MKKIIVCLCLTWMLTAIPDQASATLNKQMDAMFGSLANVTNPQAYLGQRMGAFSGGSAVVRNKIVNSNIVGFVPPHVSAGCGGIDMFGGSFSFINAKEIVTMFRSIASNAQGYFFQLALQAMCPTCSDNLSSFQKKMQQLNQLASNSCSTAKHLVNAAVVATTKNMVDPKSRLGVMREGLAQDATASGVAFTDTFTSIFSLDKKNPEPKVQAANPILMAKYTGNIAWALMQQENVQAWVPFGDQDFLETIMSITGTFIITPPTKNVIGAGNIADKTSEPKVITRTLLMKDLITGTNAAGAKQVYILRCNGDPECLNPVKTKAPAFISFTQRIKEVLLGANGVGGILDKMHSKIPGTQYTPTEKAFIDKLNMPILGMLRNIASRGKTTSTLLVKYMAPWLARQMAGDLITAMLRAMNEASNNATKEQNALVAPYKAMLGLAGSETFEEQQFQAQNDNNFQRFLQTYQDIRLQNGGLSQIVQRIHPQKVKGR